MPKPTHTYATTLAYGDDEAEIEVSFTVAWGSPASGHYGPPEHYDPGSGDEIEDLKLLSIDCVGGPFDQHYEALILQEIAQNHTEAMIAEASEDEAAREDDAREHQYESRREMAS